MAPANYAKLGQRFITWMTAHTPAGILFDIDTALRPDGASGMLVSSLAAFERYQHNAAWVWEHQALTRARFCAGDAAIGARFEEIRESVLRRDRSGQAEDLRAEVLKMRQRMHEAYPNRSALFDLKQDSGGMIDIEFIVQYLVLRYASVHPQLTANAGNIALLHRSAELGLVDQALAVAAADAYRAMRKLQHQLRLQGREARLAPAQVDFHSANVRALWHSIFG
jgi:glutamate-ammonia-ligase adenylyltransferase